MLKILELFTRKACKLLVFKQTETVEHVKNNSVFLGECKFYGWMRNFQGILFMRIRTYREIFKSALVYLQLV